MATPLRVLVVEDTPDDAELMVLWLEQEGFQVEWQRVETEADYLAALETAPDLILTDWRLPRFSGLLALQRMQERNLDIPFIVVSGSIGEEAAIDALRRGADDYVLKDHPTRLGQAVRRALEDKRLRQERKWAEEELRNEIINSKNILEANLGIKVNVFAYPFGGTNGKDIKILSEAGFLAAVTASRGLVCTKLPYGLPRIRVGNSPLSFYGL